MAREKRGLRRQLRDGISALSQSRTTTPPDPRAAPLLPRSKPREPPREPGAHRSQRSQAPNLFPDRAPLAASAHPQDQSPFFAALPAEVRRLIYGFAWRTGGHSHGIHIHLDLSSGRIDSSPCDVGRGDFGAAAEVNGLLDGLPRGPGGELVWGAGEERRLLALEERVERSHAQCDDDGVFGARNSARWRRKREGADPLVMWSPFLPVLLTCKRVYLESVDTIFYSLPLVFPLNHPTSAHAFLSQEPHPSIRYLRSIILYADHPPPVSRSSPDDRDRRHDALWRCTLEAMARLPALREVRLSLRFDPDAVHDLRHVARWAGAGLASMFTVNAPGVEGWRAPCRMCGGRLGRFIIPGGEDAGGDGPEGEDSGEDRPEGDGDVRDPCPPFGRVIWHERPRYRVERDCWPPGTQPVRELKTGVCWLCNHSWQPRGTDAPAAA